MVILLLHEVRQSGAPASGKLKATSGKKSAHLTPIAFLAA